eukprot:1431238-Amphidinium_carterae.1
MMHDVLGDLMPSCRATSLAQALSGLHMYRNHVHECIVLCNVVIHFVRALCYYLCCCTRCTGVTRTRDKGVCVIRSRHKVGR